MLILDSGNIKFFEEDYDKNIKILFESMHKNTTKQIIYKEYPKHSKTEYIPNKDYLNIIKKCKSLLNEEYMGYGDTKYIDGCKLVIVGNLGTVFFETLCHEVPMVALYDNKFSFVEEQYYNQFQKLEEAGILYSCPKRMAKHINNIIDDPFEWWYSKKVVQARKDFLNEFSSPNKYFYKFLDELEKS